VIEDRYSCVAWGSPDRGGRRIEVVYRQDCLERDEFLRAEGVSARDYRKPVLAETRAERRCEEERAEKRRQRREKDRQDRQERVGLGIPNPHLIREALREAQRARSKARDRADRAQRCNNEERLDVTGISVVI